MQRSSGGDSSSDFKRTQAVKSPASPSKTTKGRATSPVCVMSKAEPQKRVTPLKALCFFLLFFLVSCGFAASQEIIARRGVPPSLAPPPRRATTGRGVRSP